MGASFVRGMKSSATSNCSRYDGFPKQSNSNLLVWFENIFEATTENEWVRLPSTLAINMILPYNISHSVSFSSCLRAIFHFARVHSAHSLIFCGLSISCGRHLTEKIHSIHDFSCHTTSCFLLMRFSFYWIIPLSYSKLNPYANNSDRVRKRTYSEHFRNRFSINSINFRKHPIGRMDFRFSRFSSLFLFWSTESHSKNECTIFLTIP